MNRYFRRFPPGTPALYVSLVGDETMEPHLYAVRVKEYFIDDDGREKCRVETPWGSHPDELHELRVSPHRLIPLEDINGLFAWIRQFPRSETRGR